MVLIDSYSETNQDTSGDANHIYPGVSGKPSDNGQSFTMLSTDHKLTSCKFYLKKVGNPTGVMRALLFAHSGTYGSSSLPTGNALATSDDFDPSTVGTVVYALYTFTFSGANQYQMVANTKYCIDLRVISGTWDNNNKISAGCDGSSPSHSGNLFQYYGVWDHYSGAYDLCFYVYGDVVGGGVSIPVMMHHYSQMHKIHGG